MKSQGRCVAGVGTGIIREVWGGGGRRREERKGEERKGEDRDK